MDSKTVQAALLGLAIGDALGVPVEFTEREELDLRPVTGMLGGGAHGQPAGTWSDDSSMALCLLESLTGDLDYRDMMTRFLRWGREGYLTAHGETFDMGFATQRALDQFAQGTPPLECGGQGERDNGNGSLMRILPLALYLQAKLGPDFPQQRQAYQIIHDASRLTHAHPVSLIACGLYCALASRLLAGEGEPGQLQQAIDQAKAFYRASEWASYLPEFRRVDVGILSDLPRDQVSSGGYVLHTLEAALWCLLHTGSYQECALAAVNLGEDTDTTAAVAGGLAGLRYGLEAIPPQWLAALAQREKIEKMCRDFAQSLEAKPLEE